MAASYAGAGYEVGLRGESLRDEEFVACLHHARIVHIHILHKQPRTQAVVGQAASLLRQLHHILAQQQPCLILGIGRPVTGSPAPQVTVCPMLRLKESARQHTALHIRLQVDPQRHLGSTQWRLLHHRECTLRPLGSQGLYPVGLVGCIAQEVTFHHSHGSGQLLAAQLFVAIGHSLQLCLEGSLPVGSLNHQVIF